MSYAIIGFGNIGQALAKAFARSGIEVSVATTRDPESFASAAAAIGPTIIPKTLADAVKADIVFLAVRFEQHPDVAKVLPNWQGKTIVDVTNAYGVPPEDLGGQPSSKVVEQAFTGGRLVKGFNHLLAAVLDQDPAVHGGRRVVFLASDDDAAAAEIGALAENLGFAPIKLGGLSEGGLLVQARGNSWAQAIYIESVIVELETGEGKLACTVTDFPIIDSEHTKDPKLRTYQGTLPPAQYNSLGKFDDLIGMVAKRMGRDHDQLKSDGEITVEITIVADYASERLVVGAMRKFNARWQNDHWKLIPETPGTHQIRSRRERKRLYDTTAGMD